MHCPLHCHAAGPLKCRQKAKGLASPRPLPPAHPPNAPAAPARPPPPAVFSAAGYLQRCLVKNLEALRVAYDGTVRDACDGSGA